MVEEEKEKEKAKNILRKKKWVGIQHVLDNPFYEIRKTKYKNKKR